jgi:cytochrome P450
MEQSQIDTYIDKIIRASCPQHIENPYATFDALRVHGPMVRHSSGLWVAIGYRHVRKVMMSPSFGRADMYRVPPLEDQLSAVELMRKNWMLYCDQPKHTQIKQISADILKKQMNDNLLARISDISEFLMTEMLKKREFDIVEDYAYPLPLLVIAELLGVPKEDRDSFKSWSALINKTLEPCCSLEEKSNSDKIVTEIYSYFEQLIATGIRPRSMLEDLVNSQAVEGGLSKDEVIYTAMLLLIAGHETTSSMTALGMLALLHNPEKYRQLRDNPHLIKNAVDELLRFDAPVQMARRIALEDTELYGQPILKGDMVMGVFAAANYDETQFSNPYGLNFERKNLHLSFGIGTHYCLGTALAKQEGRIVFEDLITKMPMLEFGERRVIRKENIMLRGLESLPVKIAVTSA